jgi:hypothetical protein
MKISPADVCRVVALVLFALGGWSRWWGTADPHGPYYGSFVSAGLFFFTLSTLLT